MLAVILWGGIAVVFCLGALLSLLLGPGTVFPGMKDSLFGRVFMALICVSIAGVPALVAWDSLRELLPPRRRSEKRERDQG